ncbi:MAG: dephospho-CoA kinase [Pigmentiphaga sp.]|uniref:dephospho-CoA kinase n=1 Tax=Pigmentiphaga sp. TaxID=1977564 RepID=UPI0029A286AD|nr:dephospho-CoA kinase [Pigmentiphaga sp.]MDX3906823.1 dephospho-CoA kinase [Pigmentiphaga sp.]
MVTTGNTHDARPLRIGLTGGIGSGKTAVADLLAAQGAAIIDTDRIAHTLTAPGGLAIEPLRREFGPAMIGPDGAMDRASMRELVFADPGAKARLEALIHPLIGQEVEREARERTGVYQVFVVPLLVESGRWRERVHRICVVDCDEATQVARVQRRSGLAPEMVARIMNAQASRAERLAVADDIILNDGATTPEQLAERTLAQHRAWLQWLDTPSAARPVARP